MQATIAVLFFLSLLAILSAQWTDTLMDLCEVQTAFIHRLQERRREWGREQLKKEQQHSAKGATTKKAVSKEPLNVAPLFSSSAVSTFSPQEVSWLLEILGRLTSQIQPHKISEKEAHALWRVAWQTFSAAHQEQQGLPVAPSLAPGYTGRMAYIEDLLAIPMDPQLRRLWSECLLMGAEAGEEEDEDGEDVSHSKQRLIDLLCLRSSGPQPLASLHPEVLLAILGPGAMKAFEKIPEDQMGSLLTARLEGWQLTALHRIVTW